uniref:Uncharacterized protein n=1 Tax=Panagrolaimus superbus TaxID=310955 RepID=A0A914XUI0_9BILA
MFPAWGLAVDWYLIAGINLGKYLLMILLWARVSQGFTCLLVAINRCSAVLYPLDYETIWSAPIIIICVFLQIFAGSPLAYLLYQQDLHWKLNEAYATNPTINYSNIFIANEPQALKLVFKEEKAKFLVFGCGFVTQCIFCILLLICYFYMIYIYRARRTTFHAFFTSATVRQRRIINHQLFKMAFCVCTIEICFTIFSAVITTVCSKCITPNVFYAIWNSLSIIYSCCGPYVLLLCSGYSRHLVKDCLEDLQRFIFRRRKSFEKGKFKIYGLSNNINLRKNDSTPLNINYPTSG